MPAVTVYTKPFCSYCSRALKVLGQKGAKVTEIEAGFDPAARKEMLARSNGGSTYPQIFIGEKHIGGCDDMLALDRSGELDRLLGA
ncbi:MAG TPA: glutaredoxin 3 [Caulobacteraceae bacterium]|jgi:glutaredoxin 3|nr:glutaredoxin 3 [Caulobacteraceae bacterium]